MLDSAVMVGDGDSEGDGSTEGELYTLLGLRACCWRWLSAAGHGLLLDIGNCDEGELLVMALCDKDGCLIKTVGSC